MPLEKRFGKRLQRSTIDEADKPASSALKHRRPVGKYQGKPVHLLSRQGQFCTESLYHCILHLHCYCVAGNKV